MAARCADHCASTGSSSGEARLKAVGFEQDVVPRDIAVAISGDAEAFRTVLPPCRGQARADGTVVLLGDGQDVIPIGFPRRLDGVPQRAGREERFADNGIFEQV